MGYSVFDSLFVHVILHEHCFSFLFFFGGVVEENSCGVGNRVQKIRTNIGALQVQIGNKEVVTKPKSMGVLIMTAL